MRWLILALAVVFGTAVDLVAHRGDRIDTPRRALLWSAFWVGLGVCFGIAILRFDERKGIEFFSAYLLEKTLSVDNLLVFLLIFTRLRTPTADQRRVLYWGIAGAVVMRGAFISAGVVLITRLHFVLYGFGLLLCVTGARLAWREESPREPSIVRWLRRVLPVTTTHVPHRFVACISGRWSATPLLLALFAIELTDVLFAVDSIPAAFGVTRDPFVLFSSNILAVLGLRALYVMAASVLGGLRYLRYGVAAILVFVGAKMLVRHWLHVSPLTSLCVIGALLAVTMLASRWPLSGGR